MILITGASGQLASQIVTLAKRKGLPILSASRMSGADRQMDFDHPETLDFTGIKTLFLTSAGYGEDDIVMRRHGAVITAAKTAGVQHLIYTSLSSASDHLSFALAHRWTEQRIKESDMAWTILRNGLYAELIGALAKPREGLITAPFGEGQVSAVARADLAQAALKVITAPELHAERCYELAGPTAFSLPDLAQRIGASYAPHTFENERARLTGLPLLPFQPPMLMSIYAAAAAGFLMSDRTDLTTLVPQPLDGLAVASLIAQAPD